MGDRGKADKINREKKNNPDSEITTKPEEDVKKKDENKDVEGKNKEENVFVRMIRKLSFRKKKIKDLEEVKEKESETKGENMDRGKVDKINREKKNNPDSEITTKPEED